MTYQLLFEEKALSEIKKISLSGNKSDKLKLKKIPGELEHHPFTGIGKPKALKHQLLGFWSRRLNQKDRIIYQVLEDPDKLVVIVSALGHYN